MDGHRRKITSIRAAVANMQALLSSDSKVAVVYQAEIDRLTSEIEDTNISIAEFEEDLEEMEADRARREKDYDDADRVKLMDEYIGIAE